MQSPYGSNQLVGASKHTGTVGWRFEGPNAQQVQGAARVLVKQCIDQINFNGGWGQACRQIALRNGTVIKAIVLQHKRGWEPIVRVEVFAPCGDQPPTWTEIEIEIESGVIDVVGSFFNLVRVDLIPLTTQSERTGLEDDQLLDKMIVRSAKATHELRFEHREYAGPMPSYAYHIENMVETYGADVVREFVMSVALSKYWRASGKLKQLAQAKLTGLRHDTPTRDPVATEILYHYGILFGGAMYAFPENVSRTLALLTIDLGVYYLITIRAGAVLAQRLVAPNELIEAVRLRFAILQDEGFGEPFSGQEALYQRYESYLLAAAQFSGDRFYVGRLPGVVGDSIYYGWKANWRGDKLCIVTHDLNYPNPIISRLYTATVTYDGDHGLSCNIETTQEKSWTPVGTSHPAIWTPLTSEALDTIPAGTTLAMYSEFWYHTVCYGTYDSHVAPKDVPLYCFFNAESDLVVVEYTREEYDGSIVPPQSYQEWATTTHIVGPHNAEHKSRTSSASFIEVVSTRTVAVPSAMPRHLPYPNKFSGTSTLSCDHYTSRTHKYFNIDWLSFSVGDLRCLDCGTTATLNAGSKTPAYSPNTAMPDMQCGDIINMASVMLNTAQTRYIADDGVSDACLSRAALIIPDNCSEACYFGKIEQKSSYRVVTQRESNFDIAYIYCAGSTWTRAWCPTDLVVMSWGTVTQTTEIEASVTVEIDRCDRYGSSEAGRFFEKVTDTLQTVNPPGFLYDLFYPAVCGSEPWPFYGGNFNVFLSLEGEYARMENAIPTTPPEALTTSFDLSWDAYSTYGIPPMFAGWQ